jgi:hypothetical protein
MAAGCWVEAAAAAAAAKPASNARRRRGGGDRSEARGKRRRQQRDQGRRQPGRQQLAQGNQRLRSPPSISVINPTAPGFLVGSDSACIIQMRRRWMVIQTLKFLVFVMNSSDEHEHLRICFRMTMEKKPRRMAW